MYTRKRRRKRKILTLSPIPSSFFIRQGIRNFFESFFTLPDYFWQGFLSAHLDIWNLVRFGLTLFLNAKTDAKVDILSKGVVGLPVMLLRINNAPFRVKYGPFLK